MPNDQIKLAAGQHADELIAQFLPDEHATSIPLSQVRTMLSINFGQAVEWAQQQHQPLLQSLDEALNSGDGTYKA